MALTFMFITNNPKIAMVVQKCGVERIWIDLETLGKEERQHNMNTVKSHHSIDDIPKMVECLSSSELLVRVNPWNENSYYEIDSVIKAGADLVMLPMWKSVEEVGNFIEIVAGRVKTVLLLETKDAVECLDQVLDIPGIDEIHIGLNDLHLSYGMSFMFEPLANGLVERICKKIDNRGIKYGFGGIAKLGEGMLPAEKIIMEHYRLGSSRAILSRSFSNIENISDIEKFENEFKNNIQKVRDFEKIASSKSLDDYQRNHLDVVKCVNRIVSGKEVRNDYRKNTNA